MLFDTFFITYKEIAKSPYFLFLNNKSYVLYWISIVLIMSLH